MGTGPRNALLSIDIGPRNAFIKYGWWTQKLFVKCVC
jgi:hypothetical protein